MGRDSSVDIVTRHGLDGPRIESRWGRDYPHPSRPALGPTRPSVTSVMGLFPGDKATGTWRWTPLTSTCPPGFHGPFLGEYYLYLTVEMWRVLWREVQIWLRFKCIRFYRVPEIHCLTMQNCDPEKNPEKASNITTWGTCFREFNIGDHNKCLHFNKASHLQMFGNI